MIERKDYPYYTGKTVKLGERFCSLFGCGSIYRATVKGFHLTNDTDLVDLEVKFFNGKTKSLTLGVDWIIGIDYVAPLTEEQRSMIKNIPKPYSDVLLELSNFITR